MTNLECTYMGINLKNPIIAGASKLTANMDTIKKIEEAGAGAIVCASLFEEQIQLERFHLDEMLNEYNNLDAEIGNLHPAIEHGGPKEHLLWLSKVKKSVAIPVIASLNAVKKETWIEYAGMIEETGVDGIELNFYFNPDNSDKSAIEIEKEQIEILKEVKAKLTIPIAVKLSYFYSNPIHVIKQMDAIGINAFILFNRLFESEIDINTETHTTPFNLSVSSDSRLHNRFTGLLYGDVNAELIGNTGIINAKDTIKAILSGANAVQVVSTLYKNNISYITILLKEMEDWMENKGYKILSDFQGKLSRKNITDPFVYHRAQYVDLLLHSKELLGY